MKLKLTIPYNEKAGSLAETFGLKEGDITEISQFVDSEVKKKVTPSELANACVEKYKNQHLLFATVLMWNLAIADAQARLILDHLEMARMGTVMPREIQ